MEPYDSAEEMHLHDKEEPENSHPTNEEPIKNTRQGRSAFTKGLIDRIVKNWDHSNGKDDLKPRDNKPSNYIICGNDIDNYDIGANPYYNDNLDMDQQSQEFWDTL